MSAATQMFLFEPQVNAASLPASSPASIPSQHHFLRTASPVEGTLPADSQPAARKQQQFTAAGGSCRFCGCHGDECVDRTGERCCINAGSGVCSAEACQRRLLHSQPIPSTTPRRPAPSERHHRPCDCAVCSGRARGRCRRRYHQF